MMCHRFRRAVIAAAAALCLPAMACAQYVWQPVVDAFWNDTASWSPTGVPSTSADTATINQTGGTYTATLDLDLSGGLGTLLIDSSTATLDLNGNSISETSDFTLRQGTVLGLSGGTMDVTGTTTLGAAGFTFTSTLEGVSSLTTHGPLVFEGDGIGDICDTDIVHSGATCDWTGSGELKFDKDTDVDLGTSTFTMTGDGIVTTDSATASLTIGGTMLKTTGTGTTSLTGVQVINNGTIEADSGTLSFVGAQLAPGGILSTGKWVAKGGSLSTDESVTTNRADVTLDGASSGFTGFENVLTTNDTAGKITIANGKTFTTGPGTFTQNGLVTVNNAASTFRVAPGATLTNYSAGTKTLTGGTYNLQGAFQFDGADIAVLNSTVSLDGAASAIKDAGGADGLRNLNKIDTAGTLEIKNGRNFTTVGDMTVASTGTLRVGAGTTFRVAPGFTLTNFIGGSLQGGVFDIKGKLQFDKAAVKIIKTRTILDGPGSIIVDEADQDAFGALDTIDTDGDLTVKGGKQLSVRQPLKVLGKLTIGPSSLRDDSKVSVEGRVDIDEGTALLAGGFLESTELITLGAPATLAGAGTVNSPSTEISGHTSPGAETGKAGLITVLGDYTHKQDSFFDVELGGTEPGSLYDQVSIDGDVIFDSDSAGTVRVSLIDGFSPSYGDIFDIMLYKGRTGEFKAFEGLDVGGGITLVPEYLDGILRLTTIPAPGAGAAFFFALAASMRRRRV